MYLFILIKLIFYCKRDMYAENLENTDTHKKLLLLPKYNLRMACNILVYTLSSLGMLCFYKMVVQRRVVFKVLWKKYIMSFNSQVN